MDLNKCDFCDFPGLCRPSSEKEDSLITTMVGAFDLMWIVFHCAFLQVLAVL